MSQAPADSVYFIPDGDSFGATNRASSRAFGLCWAALAASRNFSNAKTVLGFIEGFHNAAVTVAAPGTDANCISYRTTGGPRTSFEQHFGDVVVPGTLRGFQSGPPAAHLMVQVGARFNEQLGSLELAMYGCFDQRRKSSLCAGIDVSPGGYKQARRLDLSRRYGVHERSPACIVAGIGIRPRLQL